MFIVNRVNDVNDIDFSSNCIIKFTADFVSKTRFSDKLINDACSKFNIPFVEVDVNNPEMDKLAKSFNVKQLPTVIFCKEGKELIRTNIIKNKEKAEFCINLF